MGLLAKVAIYIIVSLLIYNWAKGSPINPFNPDDSLLEKSGDGSPAFADSLDADEPHAIVPREVAASFYRNKNEDELELYEDLKGDKTTTVKRQNSNTDLEKEKSSTPAPGPMVEVTKDNVGNSTMADLGRSMKFG